MHEIQLGKVYKSNFAKQMLDKFLGISLPLT